MYNQTVDEYDYAIHRKDYWLQGYSYVFYVMKITVMTSSVGLNITVLVTVKLSNRLRKIPYLYMSSLAVSDLIFACNGIFHSTLVMLAERTKDWPSRPMAYSFGTGITFIFFLSMFSTYGNLILISLERWAYISQPFWYQRCISRHLAVLTIVFVWSAAAIVNVDILILGGNFPVIKSQVVRYSIIFPINHFIWCIVICSVCIHISVITLRHVKAIKKTSVGIPATIDKADLRLVLLKKKLIHARMLLFVFGSFFILLTPSVCCNVCLLFLTELNSDLIGFAKLLLCAHSNTNFFVYAFQDKDFKLALRQLFAKWCGFFCYENTMYPIQGSAVEFKPDHIKKIALCFDVTNGDRTMFAQITSGARMTQDYPAETPRSVDKSTDLQQYGTVLSK